MWVGVTGRYWMLRVVAGSVCAFIQLIYVADATVSVLPEDVSTNIAYFGSVFEASCNNGSLVVRDLYFGFEDYATCSIDDVVSGSDCLVADEDESDTSIRAMVTGESSPVVNVANIKDSSNNSISQYMLMRYYCIPDSQTVKTLAECSDNNSFLAVTDGSAIYLYNRDTFGECSCSVEVASCTSRLTVYTIVLDLYSDAVGCRHIVKITDGDVSQTLTCDNNTFYAVSNTTAASNYLLISFTSTWHGTGGIWMGFTATTGVELHVACPATAQTYCGDCGAPAAPENGNVSTPSGTTYGQNGIYTCHQGYDLVGDDETTCLANGTWSSAAPQCIAVVCGAPAAPENGNVSNPGGTTYGQKGIYICNLGYDLVGDNETKCLANITWSNAAPQCVAVECGALAAPEYGAVSTPNGTTYGQNGIYTCHQGYDIAGEADTTCLADGTWSNAAPQCVAMDCGAPASPDNGAVSTPSGTTYGQNGIYTCHQGNDMVGEADTTCVANGTWSNAAPHCVSVDCGAPAAPENGTVSIPGGTTYGKNGIYTCHQGYDLVGDAETTCLSDGTWSNPAPQCVVMGNNGGQMTTAITIILICVGVAIVAAAVIYIYWKKCKNTAVADKPRLHIRPDSAKWLPYPERIILVNYLLWSTSKVPVSRDSEDPCFVGGTVTVPPD